MLEKLSQSGPEEGSRTQIKGDAFVGAYLGCLGGYLEQDRGQLTATDPKVGHACRTEGAPNENPRGYVGDWLGLSGVIEDAYNWTLSRLTISHERQGKRGPLVGETVGCDW